MSALVLVCALFLYCTIIFEAFLVYLLYRILLIIERAQFDAGQKRSGTAASDHTPSGQGKVGSIQEARVEELPPEVIAPKLQRPPRPAGGFGSRVGESDGDTQLHKRNPNSIRRDQSSTTAESESSCATEESRITNETETLEQAVEERSKKAKPG